MHPLIPWTFGFGLGCIMTQGFHHHFHSSLMSCKMMSKSITEKQNEQRWMETVEMEDRETSKETDHHQQQKDPKEDGGPSMEYQQLLHIIEKDIKDLSAFVLMKYDSERNESTSSSHLSFLEKLVDRIRVLKFDISDIRKVDGHESWREREAKELSDLVQHRLETLQNPPNCSEVKKILCRINTNQCGVGCITHHLTMCMMVAYGFGRTMVLRSKGWTYAKEGWESIMKPVGSCNATDDDDEVAEWPGSNDYEDETIAFPNNDEPHPVPPSLPQALPGDIADRMIRLHGEPGAWYQGQLIQFISKAQPFVQKEVEKIIQTMKIHSPVVGLHIRQLLHDKVPLETRPITLEEYMKPVEEYYDALQLKGPVPVRRVFVVADLPDAVSKLRAQYKAYTFITNEYDADLASMKKRFSTESIIALYADIYLLSRSDLLVTTFSSNIGRMAYEIMQTLYPDAHAKAFSIDKIYYVHGEAMPKLQPRFIHALKTDPTTSFRKSLILGYTPAFPFYKLAQIYRLINTTWHNETDRTRRT